MMNPIVMEMLTDAHMADIQRQVEQQRDAEEAGYRAPWMTLPLTVASLLMAAILGASWIA
ncbi:MAG: hypothetical protein BMS9Abin28_1897 [Anaerolineae bacterium]|nr:MAG: hypothetical protein BMS9Abin28_1897 [Anaerolineae bacterium]